MKISKELKDPGQGKRDPDPEVLRLQRELRACGFDPKGVDGRFGGNTTTAIQGFARWRNEQDPRPDPPLRTDGIVDERLATALNARFYQTAPGIIVKDREESLQLKEDRIQGIRVELGKADTSLARKIELRKRLHKWLERKAKELEVDEFDGLANFKRAANQQPSQQGQK